MAKMKLTSELIEPAILGGSVLGGGGGGSMEDGRKAARMAVELGDLELIDSEDLPAKAMLVNVSAVGAPSSKEGFAKPADYSDAVKLLCSFSGIEAAGIITNEAGGLATVNGWLQAALLGLPVLDLPSNGRAHPTGVMGAMGLHALEGYQSIQAAIGGNPDNGKRIETVVKASIVNASAQIRNAAVLAGGFMAVARNPVTVEYAKDHGAAGAIKQAISLGQKMLEKMDTGGSSVITAVCNALEGCVLYQGIICQVSLTCKGGFDVGTVMFENFELTFWNEYMTAEKNGERLGTFPDLIMTLDTRTGLPVTSAMLKHGADITVILAPREHIRLGAGMRDRELFKACEQAVDKELVSYVFPQP